jgi:hypothetical protein
MPSVLVAIVELEPVGQRVTDAGLTTG